MTDAPPRIRNESASGPGITTVDLGPTWDRIVNLVTEHRRLHPLPKMIIGSGKWHSVLLRAGDEDRALLMFMQQDGQIIVTDFLPDPEVAYVLAIPAEMMPPTERPAPAPAPEPEAAELFSWKDLM